MKRLLTSLMLSTLVLHAETRFSTELLARAARTGDVNAAQALLEDGVDPDLRDRNGTTPLYYAAEFNELRTVQLLLAYHANPNAPGLSREPDFPATPLQSACYLGNLRISSTLVDAGAQVNARGPGGRTALHFAVEGLHLDLIGFLLEKGADLNIRDAEGTSPLDDAIWQGDVNSVAVLLANGARLNEAETKTGATPINEAAFLGNTKIVKYLLQFGADLETPDKKGYGPLENAARKGNESSAILLFEAREKLQPAGQWWQNAVDIAIKKDEPLLFEAFLRHGAVPSSDAALNAAVSAGSQNVVRVLLKNGADPNKGGTRPLEDSALRGFREIVELLLDHGAQIDHVDADSGTTALYAAASFGKREVVELLLKRGAAPNLCGKKEKTPYRAALENGFSEIATEIERHGGSKTCSLSANK